MWSNRLPRRGLLEAVKLGVQTEPRSRALNPFLPEPRVLPELDPAFRPAWSAWRAFEQRIAEARTSARLELALVREGGEVSVFARDLLPERHPDAEWNLHFAERLLKFLLWQRGAFRVMVAGPESVVRHLAETYAPSGARAFDAGFFAELYRRGDFCVEGCSTSALPRTLEIPRSLGGHLDGFRVGVDVGGSERKVAALIDGRSVFSDRVRWNPKAQADPAYHFAEIDDSVARAARHLPRIDAIGVSSAGIHVGQHTRVASLFRSVAPHDFAKVEDLYLRVAEKWGVAALAVANDGDVAALGGALELGEGPVLGLSLGTSLAAGYVDSARGLSGWLNELSFASLDFAPDAPVDDAWSGDRGTLSHYLSQAGAVRLAGRARLTLEGAREAEQFQHLQALARDGDPRALAVSASLGVYLGYTLLYLAEFYALKHVLIWGGVSAGPSGAALCDSALAVLAREAPALERSLTLHLPDPSKRQVGQAMAAASLPVLGGKLAPTRSEGRDEPRILTKRCRSIRPGR
jgi:predicted NBD/HSP70 family sugar kinase